MRDGPRGFRQGSTCLAVLRCRLRVRRGFRIQGFHLLWPGFPASSAILRIPFAGGPTTPAQCRFGLLPFRSPLLRESLLLSSPPGTEMFQFPGLLHKGLCIRPECSHLLRWLGCPIRKSPDRCLLTAPRSVSPLVASFIIS